MHLHYLYGSKNKFQIKTMRKLGVILIFFSLLQACDSNVVFSEYQSLDKANWKQDRLIAIDLAIQDTLALHNLYINLRNTKDYPYSNLFLIAKMSFPDNTIVVDTLEYEMTDANGRFLGSGFSDIKENKLFYKENVRFKQKGIYRFEVKQAMRERGKITGISKLKGVSDVGISVEVVE